MSNAEMAENKVVAFTPQSDGGLKVSYAGTPEEVLSGDIQAAAKIKSYITENQITGEFKTGDITNKAEQIGFRKTLLSAGLNILWKEGFLDKLKKGLWVVVGTESKPKPVPKQQKRLVPVRVEDIEPEEEFDKNKIKVEKI